MLKLNKIIFLLLIFFSSLNAGSMATYFIGTFHESDDKLQEFLIDDITKDEKKSWSLKNKGWELTKFTESLFKNEFSDIINEDKINIVTSKDFRKNTEKIVEQSDNIKDRKIGFLHLESNQRELMHRGTHKTEITMNLTFIQIGEEINRNTEHNSFEVKYSNGISFISRVYTDKKSDKANLVSAYKKAYTKAIEKLLNTIYLDQNKKSTAFGLSQNDLHFTIKSFKVGKKAKELIGKVFKDEKEVTKYCTILFQEALIREIRKDEELDSVVMVYPFSLNKIIFAHWKSYLKKINEVSDSYKDSDADIVIKDIKPVCVDKSKKLNRVKYIDGYHIKSLLGNVSDVVTSKKDKEGSNKAIVSRTYSQVIIPLNEKDKVDGISTDRNIVSKPKTNVAQDSTGYIEANNLKNTQDSFILESVKNSIQDLSFETAKSIKEIVKLRKENIDFKLKNLCKDSL